MPWLLRSLPAHGETATRGGARSPGPLRPTRDGSSSDPGQPVIPAGAGRPRVLPETGMCILTGRSQGGAARVVTPEYVDQAEVVRGVGGGVNPRHSQRKRVSTLDRSQFSQIRIGHGSRRRSLSFRKPVAPHLRLREPSFPRRFLHPRLRGNQFFRAVCTNPVVFLLPAAWAGCVRLLRKPAGLPASPSLPASSSAGHEHGITFATGSMFQIAIDMHLGRWSR